MGLKELFIGKKSLQAFFERMHRISLRGMNYGMGGFTETSGEKYVIECLNHIFKTGNPMIFDIGANNGDYTNKIIRQLNIPFTLHSFEPGSASFHFMKSSISHKNVFIHKLGLSDRTGTAELHFDTNGSASAALSTNCYQDTALHRENYETVNITTIDEFCIKNNIEKIDFCKIDVEGHEINVLKGVQKMLDANKIDIFQFEFGSASTTTGVFLRDFFTFLPNYDIYRILQNGIRKIDYNERFEIFMTSNYIAIRKNSGLIWK